MKHRVGGTQGDALLGFQLSVILIRLKDIMVAEDPGATMASKGMPATDIGMVEGTREYRSWYAFDMCFGTLLLSSSSSTIGIRQKISSSVYL